MTATQLREIRSDPAQMQSICAFTSFLDQICPAAIPLRQRVWHWQQQNTHIPVCATCNQNHVTWCVKSNQYRRFCSPKCAHAHASVRQKIRDTCFRKWGVDTNLKSPECREQQRQTLMAKWGVDNAFKAQQVQKKIQDTNLQRYGVANPAQSAQVQARIDATHLARYQRKRASQSHISEQVLEIKNNAELMRHWFFDLQMPVSEIAQQLGVNTAQLCVHFRHNLGIDISRHCVSQVEREVRAFVQSLVPCEFNNRSLIGPRELDIVIPSHQLAIEVDGLAWHTELRGKAPAYHWKKTQDCADQGWRLIHVLDTEWQQRAELCQSRIRSALSLNQRVTARKCDLVKLSQQQCREFLDQNHMQGWAPASVRWGLLHQHQLVAVMTLGRSRFDTSVQWELIRFCGALNTTVVGGASRLFRQFVREHDPQQVISYCDRRWNSGAVYQQLGFSQVRVTKANYWYVHKYAGLENRLRFQKHKLADLLPDFNAELTEWQNMQAAGWDRYWDAGSSVWHWSAAATC